jgi:hypothetical protein
MALCNQVRLKEWAAVQERLTDTIVKETGRKNARNLSKTTGHFGKMVF